VWQWGLAWGGEPQDDGSLRLVVARESSALCKLQTYCRNHGVPLRVEIRPELEAPAPEPELQEVEV
jgi:hypothetical protein